MKPVLWGVLATANAGFMLSDGKLAGPVDVVSAIGLGFCFVGFMSDDDAGRMPVALPWWFTWGVVLGLSVGVLAILHGLYVIVMAAFLGMSLVMFVWPRDSEGQENGRGGAA